MKACLDQSIRELIRQHPGLGGILAEAGIHCVSCGLGTCRVREILEIHDLDAEHSRELLTQMGREIHGDGPFEVPELPRRAKAPAAAFCPPLARMVEEHRTILELLGTLPSLMAALRRDLESHHPLAEQALDFLRNYADRYHHAKEEDILFGFFDGESPVIQAMRADHDEGRGHVREAALALGRGDLEALESALEAYSELLRGHIQREDTILYPWMDRTLSTHQVGELYARCAEVEARSGDEAARRAAFARALPELLG
nr:hemerythrin domain-containing protein [uncultured Holophaga sp.]